MYRNNFWRFLAEIWPKKTTSRDGCGLLIQGHSFLYPDGQVEECPVPKTDHLETEQQQPYMQWIEKILGLDRRSSKDPQLYAHTVT